MTFIDRLFHRPHPPTDIPERGADGRFKPSSKTRRQIEAQERTTAALRRYVVETQLVEAVRRAVGQ